MILFIHGFGSCGWGEKSLQLRRHFGIAGVIAPDLPFDPRRATEHLLDLTRRYPVRALVGSSLGGFYATWLNQHRALPTVLINPVVRPHRLLHRHLGIQHRWCDQAPFAVGPDFLDTLRSMHREQLADDEHYLVMLQQGDEVLDYREAAAFYGDRDLLQITGGSHRFDNFAGHLPQITAWLNRQDPHHAEETKTPA